MSESLKPADPILVVDDDERVLDAVNITLFSAGYNNVSLCADSRLVDEMLRAQPFSVVLLDLNMPFVSGNEIIRNATMRRGSPPIVVIAASTRVEDFADGVRGGIADYLVKPVDRGLLLDTLRRILSQPADEARQRLTRDFLLFDRILDVGESGMGDLLGRIRSEYRRLQDQLNRAARIESIGRLAGGLAHDFNNILLVIAGYGELIRETPGLTASAQAAADQIGAAVERGSGLVRQILSLGRPHEEDHVLVDLNEALRSMEPGLRQLLPPGQQLAVHLDAAAPVVRVGATHIDQVVRNLVLNARDAMPDGGVLTVATRDLPAEPGGPSRVALDVRDTGVGMDAATVARIFEPFFTTKPEGKGSGFGLPTTQSIVEAAGGSLLVESVPGKGSLFSVRLPRAGSR